MKTKALLFGFLVVLILALISCGGSGEEETTETQQEEVLPYDQGGAQTAEEYYYGVLEDIMIIDEKLRYVQDLDHINASADSIRTELDSMNLFISDGRDAIDFYMNEDWPLNDEFFLLSNKWFDSVSEIVNDHFMNMTEQMSKDDNSWSDGEKAMYAAYEEAIYAFYEIDEEWVMFQSEFSDANGFELDVDDDGIIP